MSQGSNEMRQEGYEKWHPLEDVPTYLDKISLVTNRSDSLLIVCHSSEDFKGDILLNCGYRCAYQVHEEFAHPSMDYPRPDAALPRSTKGYKFTFPFLKVNNSIWLSTFSESRLLDLPNNPLHLRIVTLGQTVDILCADYPKAKVVRKEAVAQLFDAIEVFEVSSISQIS